MRKSLFISFLLSTVPIVAIAQFPTKLENANYTEKPFKNVVFLNVKRNKFPWLFSHTNNRSTGFFIDKYTILTAGHNLHSGLWSKVREIKIIPGKHYGEKPYDSLIIAGRSQCIKAARSAKQYRFSNTYKRRIRNDYAIIRLTEEQSNQLYSGNFQDFFELRDLNISLGIGDTVSSAGYPADGVKWHREIMKTQSDTINAIDSRWPTIIYYDLETKKGNSGSPVWKMIKGKNIIVGIHTGSGVMTYLDDKALKEIFSWQN